VDINSLPDDPATLKGLLADMAASQADQQQQIAQLEQRIRLLNLIIYGPKSEKKPRTGQEQQLSLFDEAEQAVEKQTPQTFEEACTPAQTRGKRGRRPIPADLPRVEIVHDLPESEKACPCGAVLVRIGEEVSEKLDIVPAKIQVMATSPALPTIGSSVISRVSFPMWRTSRVKDVCLDLRSQYAKILHLFQQQTVSAK
jgi:hypothetical protein